MKMNLLFWICWLIDLGCLLVLGWDMLRRWSNREVIPLGGSAWTSGKAGLIGCSTLVAGSLVARYWINAPLVATYIVALPVLAVALFFLVLIIGALFGARMN